MCVCFSFSSLLFSLFFSSSPFSLHSLYRRILVFVIGGCTYEESTGIESLLANSNKYRGNFTVLVGGSTIHNSKSFLKEIMGDINEYKLPSRNRRNEEEEEEETMQPDEEPIYELQTGQNAGAAAAAASSSSSSQPAYQPAPYQQVSQAQMQQPAQRQPQQSQQQFQRPTLAHSTSQPGSQMQPPPQRANSNYGPVPTTPQPSAASSSTRRPLTSSASTDDLRLNQDARRPPQRQQAPGPQPGVRGPNAQPQQNRPAQPQSRVQQQPQGQQRQYAQ